MRLNSKLTGGLAWAGLALVVAVPSVDMLTGNGSPQRATTMTSDLDAVSATAAKPAPVAKPAAEVAAVEAPTVVPAQTKDPVLDAYLKKGKKLPDYLSDGDAGSAAIVPAKPVVTNAELAPVPAASAPVEPTAASTDVANVDPVKTAPVPYPANLRPHTEPVAQMPPAVQPTSAATQQVPAVTAPVTKLPQVNGTDGTITASVAAAKPTPPPANSAEAPLIIDEDELAQRQATLETQPRVQAPVPPAEIGADKLQEWDSGSLADYLRRKGLLEDTAQTATRQDNAEQDRTYEEDGSFLDEAVSQDRRRRRGVADEWFF